MVRVGIEWIDWFLWTAILFLLPGLALLACFRRWLTFTITEFFALATALSMVVAPISILIFSLLGIQQNAFHLAILLVGFALLSFIGFIVIKPIETTPPRNRDKLSEGATAWLLLLIALFSWFARLTSVKGIDFPMWTDSYQHTLIVQIIVDTGRLPDNFLPYAEIYHYTYHFAFHTIAAWFHWISGLSVARSVVLTGQIINACAVPTIFVFVRRLFGSNSIALVAALLCGLVSPMPAMFVNWGRYTQLTGQIVLPVALTLAKVAIDSSDHKLQSLKISRAVLAGLAFAGLFYAHYRIFLFGCLFVGCYLVYYLWEQRATPKVMQRLLGQMVWFGIVCLIVIAPWLSRLLAGFGSDIAHEATQTFDQSRHGEYFDFRWNDFINFAANQFILYLACAGVVWGFWRRQKTIIILTLWGLLLFAFANTHLIGILPLYSNLIVIIFLYLPLIAIASYVIVEWTEAALTRIAQNENHLSYARNIIITIAILLLGWRAVPFYSQLVGQQNSFVRTADLNAMEWIRSNTANDARFFIATQFWTPRVAHGLDAGYWIPYLAQRQTIVPPQQYAADGEAEYINSVNQRLAVLQNTTSIEQLWEKLREFGLSYVYIGARPTQLDPTIFQGRADYFTMVYHRDGVWIFKVNSINEAQ